LLRISGLPLFHFSDHHAAAVRKAAPVVNLATPGVCVRATVVSIPLALLAFIPITSGPAHAVRVLVILAPFALMLLEISLLLLLANTHFADAGTLRDAKTTRIGRGRHHAVIDGFAPA
jgi:hypothetical protein